MYGLIKFEENEEGFSVAEASVAMTALEKVGLKIQFADNLLELIDFAGGTVTNPEEYEEYRKDQEEVSQRYESLRGKLRNTYIGLGEEWEAREMIAVERVKTAALIDMAESLTIISGVTR